MYPKRAPFISSLAAIRNHYRNINVYAPFKQAWPWPRWTVAVISNRVTNIYACNVDRDHAKVVVMDKRPFYKGGRISRFDCTTVLLSTRPYHM